MARLNKPVALAQLLGVLLLANGALAFKAKEFKVGVHTHICTALGGLLPTGTALDERGR